MLRANFQKSDPGLKMAKRSRRIRPGSAIIPGLVPGKKWKIFLPRIVIWQKWEEIVGEAVSKNAWPWYFRDLDGLAVAVSDNIWMQQLTYQKAFILEKLNKELPQGSKLKDLRFLLGDVPKVKRNIRLRTHSESISPDLFQGKSPPPPREAFDLLDAIKDQELRKVLRELMDTAG